MMVECIFAVFDWCELVDESIRVVVVAFGDEISKERDEARKTIC